MGTLRIRQVAGSDPPRFEVAASTGRGAAPVEVTSPVGFPVEGRPRSDLMAELRWYLEEFLAYPFSPSLERKDHVLAALHAWGKQAFRALFDRGDPGVMLANASRGGYKELLLEIWSDDPKILAWPWEALRHPDKGALSPACRIERRLNRAEDPAPVPSGLPRDRVNILLVIARPYEGDVRFRSISRPLVELIEKQNLPAEVNVLRPPTFDRLREHLRERPHFYHLVHFDGHGAYGNNTPGAGPHAYGAAEGRLIFEDEHGKPAPVSAEQISTLLQEHQVPAMVLNACQSAMLDESAADPFASVATALLQAGTRSVVAMSYALYVSGAEQFLPAFYRRLFEAGSFAEATRAGRQQMVAQAGRVCPRGRYPLEDWIVPVLYQQDVEVLSFAPTAPAPTSTRMRLPSEALDGDNPYGFIGRDGAILALERALRRAPPAIVIHGLGGVGKTTLARGFVEWLAATGGIGAGCVWLSFQGVRSAEYVFNRLGEGIFGENPAFRAASMEQKLEALVAACKKQRWILVWDNFEDVAGCPGVPATMEEQERAWLRRFLEKIRGASTKVLITSRSEEEWLGVEQRRPVTIGGLDGEERWAYCDTILRDLGLAIDRTDEALVELMKLLDGHPLAMRAILPRLAKASGAGEIAKALQSNLAALGESGDEALRKLYATLRFVEEGLPEDLRPLLVPLGLHERFVDGNFLAVMAERVGAGWTRERIDRFLGALAYAGLLRDRGHATYEMHPALAGFLRSGTRAKAAEDRRDAWGRAFVDFMGWFAEYLAPRPLYEQRGAFYLLAASFYGALVEAERLKMVVHQSALAQGLAVYAENTRSFAEAERLFKELARLRKFTGDTEGEAAAYHQLGRIAEEQREFAVAEGCYKKSLAISKKHGYKNGAALTYIHLGNVAHKQGDFDASKKLYKKSLAIGDKQGDEQGAAAAYHQLGVVAQDQGKFAAAKGWYKKSLTISKKCGNMRGVASTYHQLGMVAQERGKFTAAEVWYKKSLALKEKQGDAQGAALTYHQLGIVAQDREDFVAAEVWYKKSLELKEKQNDAHAAAFTYGQLVIFARLQGHFEESGRWLIKCIRAFASTHDPDGMQRNAGNFRITYDRAPPAEQAKLKQIWEAAGLGELPEPPPRKPT